MQFLYIALIVLHVLLCLFLILLILIQNDKGGGLAGAFGGLGGSAAFTGTSTATFLTKLTGGLAVGLFVCLIGLNYFAMRGHEGTQQESELKSARKGLSSVLPGGGAPAGSPQGGGIPGLGIPTQPANGQNAPTAPSGAAAPAGADSKGQ
jgi:preprotein translocase subunit SecG